MGLGLARVRIKVRVGFTVQIEMSSPALLVMTLVSFSDLVTPTMYNLEMIFIIGYDVNSCLIKYHLQFCYPRHKHPTIV